jgi:hypothetical protein
MPVKNPDLLPLFEKAKALLAPYSAHFAVRKDEPGYFDLWAEGEMSVDGRKRNELFFAGLIIQKSYLGFYFMPVYTEDEAKAFFGADLLATLKGKSCFYLKKLTPELETQMQQALAKGFDLYRAKGWVGRGEEGA